MRSVIWNNWRTTSSHSCHLIHQKLIAVITNSKWMHPHIIRGLRHINNLLPIVNLAVCQQKYSLLTLPWQFLCFCDRSYHFSSTHHGIKFIQLLNCCFCSRLVVLNDCLLINLHKTALRAKADDRETRAIGQTSHEDFNCIHDCNDSLMCIHWLASINDKYKEIVLSSWYLVIYWSSVLDNNHLAWLSSCWISKSWKER